MFTAIIGRIHNLLIRCVVTLLMLACKLAMTPFLRQMENVALVYRIGMKTLKNTRKGHYLALDLV